MIKAVRCCSSYVCVPIYRWKKYKQNSATELLCLIQIVQMKWAERATITLSCSLMRGSCAISHDQKRRGATFLYKTMTQVKQSPSKSVLPTY